MWQGNRWAMDIMEVEVCGDEEVRNLGSRKLHVDLEVSWRMDGKRRGPWLQELLSDRGGGTRRSGKERVDMTLCCVFLIILAIGDYSPSHLPTPKDISSFPLHLCWPYNLYQQMYREWWKWWFATWASKPWVPPPVSFLVLPSIPSWSAGLIHMEQKYAVPPEVGLV